MDEIVSELNRIKAAGLIADYAIGGAVAAQAYIETSSTEDVDVFVMFPASSHPLSPLGPVWADLIAHGARQLEGGYLEIGGWPVQLLPPGQPLYDDAIAHAQSRPFGRESGRIMGPAHLAAIAIATGRGKDYVRVEEFLRQDRVSRAELEDLVARYGLFEHWKTFRSRFLGEQ